MTAASTTEKPPILSTLAALAFVLVVIGAGLLHFFGNPLASSQGDNLLEKALHVGASDKMQMDAFKNAGGLDKDSSWKGFKVSAVRAVYEDSGKLGLGVLTLHKSYPDHKLASINELQSAMTGECGSNWSQSSRFGSAVLEGKNAASGVSCSALDQGGQTVEVTLSKVAGQKQSVDTPTSSEALQPQANVQTATRNFEKEALGDIAFINPKEVMTDAAAVTAMRDKYPFDVVVAPQMEQVFRQLFGKDYSTLVDFVSVAGPLKTDAVTGELFGDGMVAHSGGEQGGAFTLGKNGKVTAVLVDKSKQHRISVYGASSLQQLSPALSKFVSDSRD